MKVLFLSNLYPPNDVGGYERLAFQVAAAFAARGHDVSVLTSSYGGQEAQYDGQRIDRSLRLFANEQNIYAPLNVSPKTLAIWGDSNAAQLRSMIAREQPDILFVWNLYFLDPSLLDAMRPFAGRTVLLLTDNWLISFLNPNFLNAYFANEIFRQPPPSRGLLTILRSKIRAFSGRQRFPFPAQAIFPSRFVADLHRRAGIHFSTTTMIPHGVELPHHAEETYAHRDSCLAPGELRLLFAGRLVAIKGAHTAVDALPAIQRCLPHLLVRLDIVGDQRDVPYVTELKRKVVDLDLESVVTFYPAVAEEELFDLFQKKDIYLFPSLYEPFSLTLIHALYAGIPIVASAAGGNVQVVRNEKTGLTFIPGDASALAARVVDMVRNKELRKKCAIGARRIGAGLTFGHMVSSLEEYLARVSRAP